MMASFNLFSSVKFLTRNVITSHTLIDNIFTDIKKFDFSTKPLVNGLSDHDAQFITLYDIMCPTFKQPPSYIRIIDINSMHKFSELLSYENWEGVFQDMDVNQIFNSFQNTYLRIFYSCIFIKKKFETANPKPWITTGIKTSCANKSRLFLNYRESNDQGYKFYYKKYCKVLSSIIIATKKKYYDERILNSNNKTKATWNIVKTITNTRKNSNKIVSMNIDNQPNSNPITIANAFNNHFSSVASKLISKLPGNNHSAHEDPLNNLTYNFKTPTLSLRFNHTATYEVNSIIQSLKTKDSCGYDEISSSILKISAPYILSPLTYIFNKILSTGIFPKRLKFSEVRPLYKKGSTAEFSNYRPFSLLVSFSKIIDE